MDVGKSQERSSFLWHVYFWECFYSVMKCTQFMSESQSLFEKKLKGNFITEDALFWLDWGRETESRKKGN